MNKIRALLVEDESTLAMIIKDTLDTQGFDINVARDGEDGLEKFFALKPQVLIADVMMPKMDGFKMVKKIRESDSLTPILFLTARSSTQDVIEGFHSGGDDYLKKPFSIQELVVRVRAIAARASRYSQQPARTLQVGRYALDYDKQQLVIDGETTELSYRETQILKLLAGKSLVSNEANPFASVVETSFILKELWGDDTFFNARSLQVFITKLRHKLNKDPRIRIVNVRGVGYRLAII